MKPQQAKQQVVKPTEMNRKARKNYMLRLEMSQRQLLAKKKIYMGKLASYNLTIEEVNKAMQNQHVLAEVNKVAQKLLEINTAVINLAHEKAALSAKIDFNAVKPQLTLREGQDITADG